MSAPPLQMVNNKKYGTYVANKFMLCFMQLIVLKVVIPPLRVHFRDMFYLSFSGWKENKQFLQKDISKKKSEKRCLNPNLRKKKKIYKSSFVPNAITVINQLQ